MRRLSLWWSVPALLIAAVLLYVPLAAVAWRSVNAATARQSNAWQGFTLRWYGEIFARGDINAAALNSVTVAVASTLIAVVLGTALAIALGRAPWPKAVRAGSDLSLTVPIVTPDIVIGIALVTAFGLYRQILPGLDYGLIAMIIAHVTFQIGFVTLVVRSRLALIGSDQFEAARDLYANTALLWWRVVLPQLLPGIAAGAGLAFILSVDDFMVSFFVASPQSTTLPIAIYGQMRIGIAPSLHALSTAVMVLTIAAVLMIALVRGRTTSRSRP